MSGEGNGNQETLGVQRVWWEASIWTEGGKMKRDAKAREKEQSKKARQGRVQGQRSGER